MEAAYFTHVPGMLCHGLY